MSSIGLYFLGNGQKLMNGGDVGGGADSQTGKLQRAGVEVGTKLNQSK